MQETWVRSLGWEHPLEEGMATHSNFHAMDRGAWHAAVHGVAKTAQLTHIHTGLTLYFHWKYSCRVSLWKFLSKVTVHINIQIISEMKSP